MNKELLAINNRGYKKLFSKIFEFDPYAVECHIREKVLKTLSGKDTDWLKDYDLKIEWCIPYSEFYVHLEPKLETKDYKTFSFKSQKNLTAGEYFKLTYNHWHYDFDEIYEEMKVITKPLR